MCSTLFIGSSARHLATGLKASLEGCQKVNIVETGLRVFPDGEICVDLGDGPCATLAVIIQGTHAPQDRNLHELYQIIDAARRQGASEIHCVLPYFGYGRQDRRFQAGQPATATLVFRILAALGCSRVLTYDIHNPGAAEGTGIELIDLHGADLLPEDLLSRTPDLIWIAPDLGARERVERVAARLGGAVVQLQKAKQATGETHYLDQSAPITGKDAFVVDDVCSTGSTLIPLAQFLTAHGARSVTYFATHLFADPELISQRAGVHISIMASNTVPNSREVVQIEQHLARHLIELQCRA